MAGIVEGDVKKMIQQTIFDELSEVERMGQEQLDVELIERIGFEKFMDQFSEKRLAEFKTNDSRLWQLLEIGKND